MTTPRYVDPALVLDPATGEPVSSTFLQTLRDDLESHENAPGCKAGFGSPVAVASGANYPVPLTSELWDTDGFHSVTSNTTRFTVPAGLGGRYVLVLSSQWAAYDSGQRVMFPVVNGSSFLEGVRTPQCATAVNQNLSTEVLLAAGDYVEFVVSQDSGSPLFFEAATMSIRRVGR